MKKFYLVIATVILISAAPVSAADWKSDTQAAITSGNLAEINVIAANNPSAQGAIAMMLLKQAQSQVNTRPADAIKMFNAAALFASQISLSDGPAAGNVVNTMLVLASGADFQKKNARDAGDIFKAALAISDEPNIIVTNPTLHNRVLANATDFMNDNPFVDSGVKEQVNLALQIGSPPPLGPHGVINPSAE